MHKLEEPRLLEEISKSNMNIQRDNLILISRDNNKVTSDILPKTPL